jgi:Mrp family chromosome partitioning ATPase
MSLIESALARARARAIAGGGENAAARKAARKAGASSAKLKSAPPTGSVAEPTERIVAPVLPIDPGACLENRILVDDGVGKNKAAAAAYRMLRTRLLRRARTNGWTSIGVTSATPNDGKSLTVLNLGISVAREANSEVVLLDFDMRNPSMCRYLGVRPVGQLRDYFEGHAKVSDMFFSIGINNLLLASAMSGTDRASELLAGDKVEQLIQFIKDHTANPIVLIDLPPLLITDDALVVAPKVDALLVVAAEGRTSRADLDKALGMLGEFPIAGLVLNRTIDTGLNYGYDYNYGMDVSPD